MTRFNVAPAGDLGLLLEVAEDVDLASLAREAKGHQSVSSAIPGHSSLLVIFEGGSAEAREQVLARLASHRGGSARGDDSLHEIAVSFADGDAPDLPRLLGKSALPRETLIERIAQLSLRVRFLGFLPGFAYLDGWPREWQLPRLETPRPRVPAGSFAVAGPSAGFYPSDSPGGWNLIGRSDVKLWDPFRSPPNLLNAGDRVRIVPAMIDSFPAVPPAPPDPEGEVVAEVLGPGTQSLLIGVRREANAEIGVPPGGPFDQEAASVANRAVGNAPEAVVLECALSGPRLRMVRAATLSWAGARATISVGGAALADTRVITLRAGDVLEIGRIEEGARGWLAISGGWSAVTLPGVFPMPVARGAVLRAGAAPTGRAGIRRLVRERPGEIGAIAGPAAMPRDVLEAIESTQWIVADRSSRIGIRLEPASRPPAAPPAELPSTPLQFGSVQWHPDGALIAMGPDHPITGGYLQVMTVPSGERWKLAQLAPGDPVRWRIL